MKAILQTGPVRPIEVKRGSVAVKVYPVQNRVGDKVYPQFAVVYYDGAQRRTKRVSDLEEAKDEAAFVAGKLASGENEVLQMTSTDRVAYIRCLDQLRPMGVR